MRMARKQAEDDVVTMRNRIKRLQLEELRARKNIEETRKRADDIVRLKAEKELRVRSNIFMYVCMYAYIYIYIYIYIFIYR